MGSQSGWEQPNGFHPNGLLPNATASVTRVLDPERWTKAEERTAHLLTCIQPDWPSEKHRNAVASYLQDLISKCISCQVFTFGSVPLKTYLPDGDIDLTAFGQNQNLKDNWAIEVRNMLEREEKNEHAKFQVKEVQYIQAEVKLVKCLVDNIVVDISFNQLGGLCTLCFLEEVDYLINQNHLFKRSIILIKAWCYYESRILGAHHGLISTYALETLVLYIFHVFNNCFAGPLEVLYRFLEFFSKFDWENFCVSLWGPVPISSLPNITADPPRKDGKELLLSKKFLGACSYVYSVFPSGNENHDQPFITKFFNVIDPLRTNNNLGRSVNKGNFSRIRSAFAFGAQRLARLLDCPEDNIEAELNLFFMNAWDRHGKGPRPDIAIPDTSHVQSEDSEENIRKTSSMESSTSRHSADEPITVLHSSDNVSSQNGSFPTRQTTRTMNACNLYRKSNQKVNNDSSSSVPPEQDHMSAQRINVSSKSQNDRRRNLREKTLQDEVHSVHQFARTYSSPELTNTSTEVQSQGMYNEAAERRQDKTTSKSDNSSRTRGAKTLQNCSRKSSIDEPSALHNSLQCRFATDVESNHSSDCYDDVSVPKRRDISSGSQMLDMHQGEQDFVEVSPGIQGVGDVQMHMNLASHLPFPMPPSVLGYASQNSGGMVPSNLSSFESHWGSHMHYPQTLIPLPMSPYLTNIRATADQEKMIRGFHGDTLSAESSQLDDDHGEWTEYDADYLREHSPETGSIQTKENERMQTYSSVGFVSSDEAMNSYHYGQEYQHVSTKEKESAERKYCDGPTYRESDAVSCSSSRLSAASVAKCSVAKAPSEHSWDGSPPKIRNSARNELARKVASSMSSAAVDNYEWTNEGESVDHISYEADDEDKDWVPSSTGETFTPSAASSNVEAPQVSGPLHSSYSNLLLPFSPVPIRPVLQQGVSHNHTVLPIAFYPAGPPVPFLTMLPVYNIPTETGTSGASTGHLDVGEGTPKFPETQSSHRPDSVKNVDFSCNSNNSDLVNGNTSVEHAEEHKSDIFNGDFASHWQNLQYGRLCQSSRSQVPFIYSPTVAMPPVQLQGSFQFDHHRRPLPASASPSTQLMSFDHGPTPSPPLQPTSSRPSGVYQQYGGELPRHRTGTGTYFPDPKNFLDRESLSPRLQRGNYSHDRREHHGGREANWIVNSKPRFAGRGHVRYQSDKPGVRMYRSLSRGRQTERHWDKFRLNSNGYHLSNGPSTSSKFSQYVPGNVDYAMYHMASVNSNEVSTTGDAVPSVFMLYPYDQTMGYVSPAEQLKFGSVRTLHEGGIDEVREPNEYLDGAYEPSNYQGNSAESSPDQPSSPSFRGRFHRRP